MLNIVYSEFGLYTCGFVVVVVVRPLPLTSCSCLKRKRKGIFFHFFEE